MPRNPVYPGSEFPNDIDEITNQPSNEIPDAIRAVQLALKGSGPAGTALGGMTLSGNLLFSPSATYSIGTISNAPNNVYANALRTRQNLGSLTEAQSGGMLTLTRASGTPSSPGANVAVIYFRDGTTAGTLKLVVRAGAAGAETTILDNIPQ